MNLPRPFTDVDYEGFAKELAELRDTVDAKWGAKEIRHLKKIELWGRLCSLVGYLTAWLVPNPFSAALISQGSVVRWTIMMHHVGHKGYDRVPGIPAKYTSKVFAQGWRRYLDFFDWMLPEAWLYEHNILHHYHTGEHLDPDLVERNVRFLRRLHWPLWLRYFFIAFFAMSWKFAYYVPSTVRVLYHLHRRRAGVKVTPNPTDGLIHFYNPYSKRRRPEWKQMHNPFSQMGKLAWLRCNLPYAVIRFGIVPALFLVVSPYAWACVLVNSLLAEVITNLHTFLIIVPNHGGDDVYKFYGPSTDRAEYYVRQVLGSVNYRTGGDFNDFMHGWLNYQIEHHLWPDIPMLTYQELQPKVKALCAKYGIPYVQEGVFTRVRKLMQVIVGTTQTPTAMTLPKTARMTTSTNEVPMPELSHAAAP